MSHRPCAQLYACKVSLDRTGCHAERWIARTSRKQINFISKAKLKLMSSATSLKDTSGMRFTLTTCTQTRRILVPEPRALRDPTSPGQASPSLCIARDMQRVHMRPEWSLRPRCIMVAWWHSAKPKMVNARHHDSIRAIKPRLQKLLSNPYSTK